MARMPDATFAQDSCIYHDVFPHDEAQLRALKAEVAWQTMYHASGPVPRLVCAQGDIGKDGSMPIYRHPADQVLPLLHMSPAVDAIRRRVETLVGHSLNHVLVQLYRSGDDFISEHADKTLDICAGTSIVNVSLGALRKMQLRKKRQASGDGAARQSLAIPLPHGSVFVLGLETNRAWLHSIKYDRRLPAERSDAERAFGGQRLSLTFRAIGTFLSSDSRLIWGQGAVGKTRAAAKPTVNGDAAAAQAMINAFGYENQQIDFDWVGVYGGGFDVLNLHSDPGPEPVMLFLGENSDDNAQAEQLVRAALVTRGNGAELLVCAAIAGAGAAAATTGASEYRLVKLRDVDARKTEVAGVDAIERYLQQRQ